MSKITGNTAYTIVYTLLEEDKCCEVTTALYERQPSFHEWRNTWRHIM